MVGSVLFVNHFSKSQNKLSLVTQVLSLLRYVNNISISTVHGEAVLS